MVTLAAGLAGNAGKFFPATLLDDSAGELTLKFAIFPPLVASLLFLGPRVLDATFPESLSMTLETEEF